MITDSRIRALTPLERALFLFRMKTAVFFHYLLKAVTGTVPIATLPAILKRLMRFSKKQKHAKFMLLPNGIRMGLYIPSYPGKAFFRASEGMCLHDSKVKRAIAVVSITKQCNCNCDYCYQQLDTGAVLDLKILQKTVREMQNDGVAIFVLEGGDPFLEFNRLSSLCDSIDGRSEIWINTTGNGVTKERLITLKGKGLTALKISIHHNEPQKHEAFLKRPGAWQELTQAVKLCNELEIPFCFNTAFSEEDYNNGHFAMMMDLAKEWNAAYIQCLTPRSAGGFMGKESISYSSEKVKDLGKLFSKYNRSLQYRDYPAIFCDEYDERAVFGCTAGGAGRIYLNAQGDLQPCQHINVSFGNVVEKSYTGLITEAEKIFSQPGKRTACTMIAPAVAKAYEKEKKVPIPFSSVKEEWIQLRNEDQYDHNK